VRLSWLENAIHVHFSASDFDPKVGQTDLVVGVRSGFIGRSAHAKLQVAVSSGYDLLHPGQHSDTHSDTQLHIAF